MLLLLRQHAYAEELLSTAIILRLHILASRKKDHPRRHSSKHMVEKVHQNCKLLLLLLLFVLKFHMKTRKT